MAKIIYRSLHKIVRIIYRSLHKMAKIIYRLLHKMIRIDFFVKIIYYTWRLHGLDKYNYWK